VGVALTCLTLKYLLWQRSYRRSDNWFLSVLTTDYSNMGGNLLVPGAVIIKLTLTLNSDHKLALTQRCGLVQECAFRGFCCSSLSKVKYVGIAVCSVTLPHCYGNSHAIWDHTVLHATQQRWHSCLYPSRSSYSISSPGRMQGWVDLGTAVKVCSQWCIGRYTPYTNFRVFLTAYTHLCDHK